jgi:WD40 repeat protein/energy-coupling factor transporter ATP-binding protein EcfA2
MNTFEITIQRKSGDSWPIVAEYTQANILLPLRSEGSFNLTSEDLQQLTSLQERLQDYGTFLGKKLIRDDVRDGFIRALSQNEEPLRMLLFIEAADKELRTLRWERLCAPIDGNWQLLAINQRVPFSFYIPAITDRLFPPIGRRDLRALVLVASPADSLKYNLATFDVESTVKSVRAGLGDIPTDVLAAVDGAIGLPTLDELCTQLTDRTKQYTILHFVSHGRVMDDGETLLYWSKPDNATDVVKATRLIERLRPLRGARGLPHFTFLCSCESASPETEGGLGGLGQRLVRDLGMPAVVAMTDKVTIRTAQTLIEKFYFQLRESGEVDSALHEATASLAEHGDIAVPALFSRLGGRPLFSDQLDRELTNTEIQYGLERILQLIPERSPTLLQKFTEQAQQLQNMLGADATALSKEAQKQREQLLTEVNELCEEVLDINFHALALGQKPPNYDSRCPFLGLYPFRVENREFFFGREQLISQLQQKLGENNFLAVLGASGSGKSSVVLAGLIPALQKQEPDLVTAYMTPSHSPIEKLQTSLAQVQGQTSILVIDQFEELFTLCTDETQRLTFIEKLLILAQHQKVIITMRADFWGECATYKYLKDLMEARQKLIGPMDAAELRKAMEMQAAQVGLRFEVGLSNAILDDVQGEPGAMPLLQHALLELWKRRHGRWLRSAEYEAIGGVNMAIAQTADEVYNGLSAPEQDQVKNIFIRLTRLDESAIDGEKRRDTRRRVWLDELVPAGGDLVTTKQLVLRLAGEGARLVVTSVSDCEREEVEVAHEALIRYWPRLLNWLDENRVQLQLRESIRQAALEWEKQQKDENYLVHRGGRLEDAQGLAKHTSFLNQLEAGYITACVQLHQRHEQEKEARRRREIRTAWGVAGGAVAALIVTAGLGIAVWNQKRTVEITKAEFLGQYSLSLFASGQQLNALITGIKAGKILQDHNFTQNQVVGALQTAIYGVKESNRLEIDNSIVLSPDGKHFATYSDDGVIKIWDVNGEVLHTFTHDEVNNIIFSPDGETLASISESQVKLWNLAGQALGNLTQHQVKSLVFNSNSNLAFVSGEGKIHFWDLTNKEIKSFSQDKIESVAFSPNGKTLASIRDDHKIQLWDLTGKLLLELENESQADSLVFSPDGKNLLLIPSQEVTLKLWNLENKKLVTFNNDDKFATVVFSPDSKKLISGGQEGKVTIWNLAGKSLVNISYKAGVDSIVFSPDGKTFATGSRDNTIKIWDLNGEKLLTLNHQDFVSSIVFSADSKTIVSATDSGSVSLWNLQGKIPPSVSHEEAIESIAFSPDGKIIASASDDKTVNLWDVTGKKIHTLKHESQVNRVLFNPNGKTLASVNNNNIIEIWDINGKKLHSLPHQHEINSLVFSPDGETLVSASDDGSMKLWNVTGKEIRTLKHQQSVKSVVFSPDGKILASASDDKTAKLWDLTGKEILTLKHQQGVEKIVFSHNGKTLVTSDRDIVQLWDLKGKELHIFKDKDSVKSVVFSPDDKTLATVLEDKKVKLWNLKNKESQTLNHQTEVISVVFSADGKALVSHTVNYAIKVWDLSGRVLYTLQEKLDSDNQPFNADGKAYIHYSKDKTLLFSSDGKTLAATSKDNTVTLWDWELNSLMANACDWASNYLNTSQETLGNNQEVCKK